jgi:hypothetical protein
MLLHAGGVLADAALANQSLAGSRAVVAPKISALQLLRRCVLALGPTAHSMLFSSVAALLGSAGQTNYSYANAALDAAARELVAAGLPAVSVQFSAWAGAGMASATASKVQSLGIGALTPAAGLAALQAALAVQPSGFRVHPVLAASPFNWDKLLGSRQQVPPLLSEFSAAAPAAGAAAAEAPAGARGVLPGLTPEQLRSRLQQQVADAVNSVLGGAVAADAPLMSAGLDSLGAVELRCPAAACSGVDARARLGLLWGRPLCPQRVSGALLLTDYMAGP